MLVACQEGHLETVMHLSAHGASRFPSKASINAEELAMQYAHDDVVSWLRKSADYTPLHHIQVLTPERTLFILRNGTCSPFAGRVSAVELATQHARTHPGHSAASLVVCAAAPWSPSTHKLWGASQRERAVELMKLGYLFAAQYAHAEERSLVRHW